MKRPKPGPAIGDQLASQVGCTPEDLRDLLALRHGAALADQLQDIGTLTEGAVTSYIARVNNAMLSGALPAQVGKIMLYGAQLFLSAQQQELIANAQARTNALNLAAPASIDSGRKQVDRRFKATGTP